MATADEYAQWIVQNKSKRGTREFDIVAKAYEEAKREEAAPPTTQELPESLRARPEAPSEVPGPRRGVLASVGQGLANIGAGAIRGAGSIGATILAPADYLEAAIRRRVTGEDVTGAELNRQRREGMTTGLQMLGAEPESLAFKAGQIGGEIAGTAGVGGALAAPVRMAARAAPAIAPAATPLASALQTGGLTTTGAATRLGGAAARVAGGTTAGAVGAGLVSPTAEDIATGAAIGAALPAVAVGAKKAIGAVADLRRAPLNQAAAIARGALGEDLDQAINALRNAPPGVGVAEATANIRNPAWQRLVQNSLEDTPAGSQFLVKFNQLTDDEARNILATLAGGTTATETRAAAKLAKETLKDLTSPARQAALTRAGQATRVAELEREAVDLSAQAAQKVEDVRRLTAAGEKATAASMRVAPVPSQPRVPPRYTYPGELAAKADEWASQAATGSLDLGQGARFAKSAAESMREAGINPDALNVNRVVGSLQSFANDPAFAGNDVMQASVKKVADDLAAWSNSNGVIDPVALDAIRKNSVNATVQKLLSGQDPSVQKKAASDIMEAIRPKLIDAIENAGGVGYRQYLEDYTKGMQEIAKQKLKGEALRLWKTDKNAFVRLVEGESPEVVEKFLGRGNYDIARELADNEVTILQSQAKRHLARLKAAEDASLGQKALVSVIEQVVPERRIPGWFNFWATAGNNAIKKFEEAVGRKTADRLARAMQTPETATNLLESLPASERARLLKLIDNPRQFTVGTQAVVVPSTGSANALAPEREETNALAR